MTETQTTVLTCNCTVCNGLSARVRGDGKRLGVKADGTGGRKMTPTAVHNIVRIAHSPLSRVASAQASGPWAV